MPAPDYATLYNVEDAIEEACRAIIVANGFPHCYIQRDLRDVFDTRVEIQLQISGAQGDRDDAWTGQLIFDIFSDRSADAPRRNGLMRGMIRGLFSRFHPGKPHPVFTADVLPYHVVNRLVLSNTDPQASFPGDCDNSALYYEAVISVRPGQHPVEDKNLSDANAALLAGH